MQLNNQEFRKLGNIHTIPGVECDIQHAQIAQNVKRPYKYIQDLSVWNVRKDINIALVGGGPSLCDHLDELRKFDGVIVACGSVHDYLVKNKIISNYAVVCDPDIIASNYLKYPNKNTHYLVATLCHNKVFETLAGVALTMWHCWDGDLEFLKSVDDRYMAISGGCTVGLRSLNIAVGMGYKNIHFFGFDSCVDLDKHHAYEFNSDEKLGRLYEVKLDSSSSKTYICEGYHLGQVRDFQDFYFYHRKKFNPVFHGSGYLSDVFNVLVANIKEQEQNG